MSDESGEKTEEPTQKKIDDARKRGQVWKSRDLTGLAVFLTGLGVMKITWGNVEEEFMALLRFALDHLADSEQLGRAVYESLWMLVRSVLLLSGPVIVATALVATLVEFLQVGPLLSTEALLPKMEKLNPINGFKNLFSKKQLVELLKSTLKMSLAGYVVFRAIKDSMSLVVAPVSRDLPALLAVQGELIYTIVVRIGLLFVVFSIFDIWWQHKSYMKDLMMTKDEVKREYKESEGDPHHKAKRREMHMEILESAQMEAVKGADVVVTNPHHIAVALRYEHGEDAAPRVVARAVGAQAQALKALARAERVPMLRNVPLAHALLDVELGAVVPESLHDPVAEVLVWVYGLLDGGEEAKGQGVSARVGA